MDGIALKYLFITWMYINIKKLMYYFLKLYKSPSFDRFIDLEHVENCVVLVFVTKLIFFNQNKYFIFFIILKVLIMMIIFGRLIMMTLISILPIT